MPLGVLNLALQAGGQHRLNGGKAAPDAVEVCQHQLGIGPNAKGLRLVAKIAGA